MGARAIKAAVIGALCGAGWASSVHPVNDVVCGGRGLQCLGTLLLVLPVMLVVFMLVGLGLLVLARFSPAWPTASGGPAATLMLFIVVGMLGNLLGANLLPFAPAGAFAVVTAAGYALAAVLSAGYGGRRDGTEHSGQDG